MIRLLSIAGGSILFITNQEHKGGDTIIKILNIGINDSTSPLSIKKRVNNKTITIWKCPYYTRWAQMLTRCYSDKLHNHRPTYKNCTVCDEWLTFSNFKSWMETQDWEGKQLDKDLRVYQNKVYSPETCCFVSQDINSFLTKPNNKRNGLPLGVRYSSSKQVSYRAEISYKNTYVNLGNFLSKESAHLAWQTKKMEIALEFYNKLPEGITKEGLHRVYEKLKHDIDTKSVTEDF